LKTIKKYFTALDRSLHEAVRIRRQSNNPTMISLNSRAEFGFSSLSYNECSKYDDKQSNDTIQNVFEFRESKERASKK